MIEPLKEREREIYEVFTPEDLVNKMLDYIPKSSWKSTDETFLDNSCGIGNFLVAVYKRLRDNGHSEENALSRIYGVDIMEDNVQECRQRLDPDNKYPEIVNQNIVCADALTYHYRFDGSNPKEEENFFEF